MPGNDSNLDFNLDLQANSAERVVQFTAHHEFRHNFPLTSIGSATGQLPANFYEEALPGVHVDVGGGYPDPYMATPHSGAWRIRTVSTHMGVGSNFRTVQSIQERAERNGHFIRVDYPDVYIEDRERIYHELSYWALSKMVEHTTEAELPFAPIHFENNENLTNKDKQEHFYYIPPELKASIHEWQATGGSYNKLALPCILHWNMNHFVVLKKVSRNSITILDPARGERRIAMDEVDKSFSGIALELTPTSDFKKTDERIRLKLSSFWTRVRGLVPSLTKLFILSLLLQIFLLAAPYYTQTVVDEVIVSHDKPLLVVLALGFGFLVLMRVVTNALRGWVVLHLAAVMSVQMGVNLFRHLIHLPLSYFEKRHMGDVVVG